jgi:hypothetical protein
MRSDKQDRPTREELIDELFEARAAAVLTGGIPFWAQPEKPESLRGWIAGRDTRTGNFGPREVLILKRRDTGEFIEVYGSATALAGQIEELDPQIGEEVVIAFLGMVTSKLSGREYASYRLLIHRDDGETSVAGTNDDGPDLFREKEKTDTNPLVEPYDEALGF